jgi:HEPN domain-containing protein
LKPPPQRWLRQAESDLQAARDSFSAGHYDWACFQAQQGAEKALKALLYQLGHTSIFTHSVADLVDEAGEAAPELSKLAVDARFLDTFYLSTRYPNALASERAPVDYYSREEAERCLSSAESILTAVKSTMPG